MTKNQYITILQKLKLRVETAMKLDDQKKAIAKQEKDEFKAMKEDMENVKKQEEAIMVYSSNYFITKTN